MNLRDLAQKIWQSPVFRVLLFFFASQLIYAVIVYGQYYFMRDFFNAWNKDAFSVMPRLNDALAVVAAYVLMIVVVDKRAWSSTGLVVKGLVPETAGGFAVGALIISLVIGCTAVLGSYQIVEQNANVDLVKPIIFLFLAAVSEEVFCRGYVFQSFERSWGTVTAISLTALIFGFGHMFGTSPVPMAQRLYGCVCLVVESGLLYNCAYLVRRRLWFPIGLHWAWNYLQGPIYGAPVSGLVYWTPLFKSESEGSTLVTGGSFGPEAGLPALVIRTLFGLFLLILAYRGGQFFTRHQATVRKW